VELCQQLLLTSGGEVPEDGIAVALVAHYDPALPAAILPFPHHTVPRRSALCHSLFLPIGVEQTAVVLVQSLQDYANSQAKPQDEVLQGHGATDLVLCVDEPEQQCFFLVLQQSGELFLAL